MTRRTAAERHLDSAPTRTAEDDLTHVLVAFHHPIRRWLAELLRAEGPANVGQLAARTGLAAGSVSHHLKVLHRHDFIEPAPDLARDTRESWWRLKARSLSWSADDFEEGSLGHRVAQAAELENFRSQARAVMQWLRRAPAEPKAWRTAGTAVDSYVPATEAEVRSLAQDLEAVIRDWSAACLAAAADDPSTERRPVRAIARVFPSEPVRP